MYTQRDALRFIKDKLEPKLTQRELDTLRFEQRRSQLEGCRASHMFSVADIYALVQRKAEMLGLPLVLPPPSPFDNWWNPKDTPLVIHKYTPPKNTHPNEPPPETIIWDGEHCRHRNLLLKDACTLYCVEEDQLEDLAKASRWLDAKTVAMRAVYLHGGIRQHNEIVVARRRAAWVSIEAKQAAARNRYCDGQPSEHYSDYLEEQIELKRQSNNPATFHLPWYDRCRFEKESDKPRPMEEWSFRQRQVKQFAPLLKRYPALPNHGDEWLHHGSGYFDYDRDLEAA
ncbi:hypothetical protein PENSPDRAFT_418138 [Peniophora sp. CONT]|nr:hypothetical protein PENSPDRAFT_418138 [Peniophora sp. CONT]